MYGRYPLKGMDEYQGGGQGRRYLILRAVGGEFSRAP